MAQFPPGVLFSTTVPYSPPPNTAASLPAVNAVAVDAAGNTYITGSVSSGGLPGTPGVLQSGFAGGLTAEAFIAKFDTSGTLVFLTYLGGTGTSIAVDASGDIYVGGITSSSHFPLGPQGCQVDQCTFVAKLSGDGKSLIWSTTILGTSGQLALAPDGSVYVLSETVVMEVVAQNYVSPSLTELNGNGQEVDLVVPLQATALAVGTDGSVYTGGPGFVAKMNSSLSGNTWLSDIGGNGTTAVSLIVPAPDGSLWVTGSTSSTNFPVLPGALQSHPSPYGSSGYLVHLSADGSQTLASTYLPSPLRSLALDASGDPVVGAPYQGAFEATVAAQWPCQQPTATGYSGFVGKLDSAVQHVLWGTSTGPSVPIGPATVDNHGNAVVAGTNVQGDLILSALSTSSVSPHLVESCIAPSAYGGPGPLAPGELFSIYGAGFGPPQGAIAQPSGGLIGTSLGGLQVLVENTPVPLLYVSAAQINAVAPFLLQGRTAAHIKIVTSSSTSNEVVLGVRDVVPEIFAVSNRDGAQNSQAHPAHAGDYLSIWASGVGQTNPPGVDGAIPTAAGGTPLLPITLQLATVQSPNPEIPGPTAPPVSAQILYAGNAPGLVSGVTQINFEMPELSSPLYGNPPLMGPPYAAAVTMTVGGVDTSAYVWFE
jgi:uncharacterized protein (TIGR03437 family)